MEEDTYYVEAEDSEYAHCAPCADAVSSGAKSTVGVCVIVLLVLVSVGAAAYCCMPKRMERLWTSMFAVIEEYTLGNKLKILIGYYMIATRVEHVYEVFLPAEVRGLLKQIRIVISLGIESIPLGCVGANGYVKRLLFWMITPLVLVLISFVGVLLKLCFLTRKRKADQMITWPRLLELATPIMLRIFFVVYPIVTNGAYGSCPTLCCGAACRSHGCSNLRANSCLRGLFVLYLSGCCRERNCRLPHCAAWG